MRERYIVNEQNRNTFSVIVAVNYSLLHFKKYVILIHMCVHIEPCNHQICVSKETNGKDWEETNQENLHRVTGWQGQIRKGVSARDRSAAGSGSQSGGLEKN